MIKSVRPEGGGDTKLVWGFYICFLKRSDIRNTCCVAYLKISAFFLCVFRAWGHAFVVKWLARNEFGNPQSAAARRGKNKNLSDFYKLEEYLRVPAWKNPLWPNWVWAKDLIKFSVVYTVHRHTHTPLLPAPIARALSLRKTHDRKRVHFFVVYFWFLYARKRPNESCRALNEKGTKDSRYLFMKIIMLWVWAG